MMRSPSILARLREVLGLGIQQQTRPLTEAWVVPQTGWRKLLTPEEMRQMATICPPRPFSKDETIYRQGDPAESLYILLEGHVKIVLPSAGGGRLLAVVGPDDFFGESFLTRSQQRQSEAVCLSPNAMACPISRGQFLQVAEQLPGVVLTIATVLAERNRTLEEELRHSSLPAEARLASVFLALSEQLGSEIEPGLIELKLGLRQEELGSMAGASRVTTTQTLSLWRERGWVEGTRGEYRIRLGALRELVERIEWEKL